MFEVFKKYLSDRVLLEDREVRLIQSLSKEKKLTRKEFLLHEGQVEYHINFISKGLLRHFCTDHKGGEYILKFAHENRWINDRESYLNGRPATANIDAIEDSEIIAWKKDDFDILLKEIPAFKEIMRDLSNKNQIASQNRLYLSISLPAEEKYQQFVKNNTVILNRVPLHMIACYLGVTRETLSRIRRQSLKK